MASVDPGDLGCMASVDHGDSGAMGVDPGDASVRGKELLEEINSAMATPGAPFDEEVKGNKKMFDIHPMN